jgi:FAD/FMN-containing dehydrogenase
LLQAEVVTADARVRVVNAGRDPDLFWALKGGGGGTFGVVTQVTLRVRELPSLGGGVFATIQATSDAAFKRLIDRFVGFCRENLINPHWGETVHFHPGLRFAVSMVSQGLSQQQMHALWNPFFAWIAASSQEFRFKQRPRMLAVPARHWWDPRFWSKTVPGVMTRDDRVGAPAYHAWWTGDGDQAGQFLYGFGSSWLPRSLLDEQRRSRLVNALFESSKIWPVSLHFNKGLAGAPEHEVEAARNTATNPAVLDAFALAILGAGGPAAYTGLPGAAPDLPAADRDAAALDSSLAALRNVIPDGGSYVSESDFFEKDWQRSFWGGHYPRLLEVKRKYDPTGLFFVHHGVGSEDWSADGFTRIRSA